MHLATGEEIADRLHAGEEDLVDDLERRTVAQGFIEIGGEPVAVTLNDPVLETAFNRPATPILEFACERGRIGEQLQNALQWIVRS